MKNSSTLIKRISSIALSLLIGCTFTLGYGTEPVMAKAKANATPSKVTGLKVTPTCNGGILTWDKAKNADGYQIYKGSKKLSSTTKRTYKVTGLKAGTTYTDYKVRAYNKYSKKQYYNTKYKKWVNSKPKKKNWKGKKTQYIDAYKKGSYSSTKSIKTKTHSYQTINTHPATFLENGYEEQECKNCGAKKTVEGEKAGISVDLHAKATLVRTDSNKYGVLVTWDNASGVTGYEVEKSTDGENYTQLYYSGAAQYYDEAVTNGGKYFYRVTAYKKSTGEGDSNVFSAIESTTSITVKYTETDDSAYDEDAGTYTIDLDSNSTGSGSGASSLGDLSAQSADSVKICYTIRVNNKTVADKQESPQFVLPNVVPGKTYEIIIDKYECYSEPDPETGIVPEPKLIEGKSKTITIPIAKSDVGSNSQTDTAALDRPIITNVTSTATTLKATWNKVSGARRYKMYVNNSLVADISASADLTSSCSYGNLIPDTDYNVKVVAERGKGKIQPVESTVAKVRTSKLGAPQNIKVKTSKYSAEVSWDAVKGATGYYIYKPNNARLAETTSTSFTITDLTPETEYNYTIEAINTISGKSKYSEKRSSIAFKTNPYLDTPTNFKATSNVGSVTLRWDPVEGADKYYIYNGSVRKNTTETTYEFTNLEKGTTYTFELFARKEATATDIKRDSDSVSVKAKVLSLNAPTGLTATADQDTFKLKWDAVTNAKKYRVYLEGELYKEVTGTSCTVENLCSGCSYTVSVTAVSGTSEGKKASIRELFPSLPQTFPIKKNVTLQYGDTEIYLGQQWSSSIKTALEKGSSGTETVTRKQGVEATNFRYYDETVYMIDIGDYNNFLVVYVADGQIIGWQTTAPTFGTHNGKAYKKGDSVKDSVYGADVPKTNCVSFLFPNIEVGNSIIGGFEFTCFPNTDSFTSAGENRVALHFINAYRVAAGLNTVVYNKFLDGGTSTWSGTISGKTYTNIRYGAQPAAETMAANNYINHGTEKMTKGVLAGIAADTRAGIIWEASNRSFRKPMENATTGCSGEGCLVSYINSAGHMAKIVGEKYKYIGSGFVFSGGCQCSVTEFAEAN